MLQDPDAWLPTMMDWTLNCELKQTLPILSYFYQSIFTRATGKKKPRQEADTQAQATGVPIIERVKYLVQPLPD